MAKINISRIFEISRMLATDAGRQLQPALIFLAELSEQSLRALKNGLTLRENFKGEFKVVSLTHNVDQVVSVTQVPTDVFVGRAFTTSSHVDWFGWYMNADNNLVVNAGFVGSPSAKIDVRLDILF